MGPGPQRFQRCSRGHQAMQASVIWRVCAWFLANSSAGLRPVFPREPRDIIQEVFARVGLHP